MRVIPMLYMLMLVLLLMLVRRLLMLRLPALMHMLLSLALILRKRLLILLGVDRRARGESEQNRDNSDSAFEFHYGNLAMR